MLETKFNTDLGKRKQDLSRLILNIAKKIYGQDVELREGNSEKKCQSDTDDDKVGKGDRNKHPDPLVKKHELADGKKQHIIKRERRSRRSKKVSGYFKRLLLSDKLAAIVGKRTMSRPDIVSTLWAIAKERSLTNGNIINCDKQLANLFGRYRVSFMSMLKYLSTHMKQPDDLQLCHFQNL